MRKTIAAVLFLLSTSAFALSKDEATALCNKEFIAFFQKNQTNSPLRFLTSLLIDLTMDRYKMSKEQAIDIIGETYVEVCVEKRLKDINI